MSRILFVIDRSSIHFLKSREIKSQLREGFISRPKSHDDGVDVGFDVLLVEKFSSWNVEDFSEAYSKVVVINDFDSSLNRIFYEADRSRKGGIFSKFLEKRRKQILPNDYVTIFCMTDHNNTQKTVAINAKFNENDSKRKQIIERGEIIDHVIVQKDKNEPIEFGRAKFERIAKLRVKHIRLTKSCKSARNSFGHHNQRSTSIASMAQWVMLISVVVVLALVVKKLIREGRGPPIPGPVHDDVIREIMDTDSFENMNVLGRHLLKFLHVVRDMINEIWLTIKDIVANVTTNKDNIERRGEEINWLGDQIEALLKKVQSLEDENTRLKKSIQTQFSEVRGNITEQEVEMDNMKSSMSAIEKTVDEANDEIQILKSSMSAIEKTVNEANDEIQILHSDNEALNKTVEKLSEKVKLQEFSEKIECIPGRTCEELRGYPETWKKNDWKRKMALCGCNDN